MLVGGEREADFAHGDPFQSATLTLSIAFLPSSLLGIVFFARETDKRTEDESF